MDWEHLPTYEEAVSQLTPLEKYLRVKTKELMTSFEAKFKETIEVKEQIYKEQIVPHIEAIVAEGE